ncbi:prepilin-type N-terminal cleavage/methylation domain-containing protein [Candidatus Pelagibacter sp.]|nr:prepilin-type N-terminal cleavage/methylation domain-containing protein [Candidatus Pelagibacter sp.]|tara:strand:+ start:2144 stop:2947 length:804 start_codon:yes stop_codon:yes gene_type:complete
MINTNIKGITLIEILIGIVISSIMMGAMLTSYNVVNGSYSQIIDKASIGNSSRSFSEMLLRDIRMAGYKYFDDNLITETNGNLDIPIEITKSNNEICCDSITLVYGDFDRTEVGDARYIRYKVQYTFTPQIIEGNIVDGIFQILKTKQKWNNTGNGEWQASAEDLDTYTEEIVTDFISDIEIVAKDSLGNIITPPPALNNENRNQIYSIYTVEIFLTYRSKKNFYKSNRERTVSSLYENTRNQVNSDRFLRESIILNAYTRNLEALR